MKDYLHTKLMIKTIFVMDPVHVSFDYRFASTSSIRCLERLKPYTPIEISSSLGLMGFSSWASLTNPKVGLGKKYKRQLFSSMKQCRKIIYVIYIKKFQCFICYLNFHRNIPWKKRLHKKEIRRCIKNKTRWHWSSERSKTTERNWQKKIKKD